MHGQPTWEKKLQKFGQDLDAWYAQRLTKSAQTCDPDPMELKKSAGKTLMSLAAATALHAMGTPAKAAIPEWRETVPMTAADAPQTMPTPRMGTKWVPAGLATEMHPIAHLESSWGKFVAHDRCPGGDYHTAHGALGFKPSTAHHEYKRSKTMQKAYPDLHDEAAFMERFREDPHFYNAIANRHFGTLKSALGGDARKAAFGWRWGIGAAQKATQDEIAGDDYVKQYAAKVQPLQPAQPQLVAKSETGFYEVDDVGKIE